MMLAKQPIRFLLIISVFLLTSCGGGVGTTTTETGDGTTNSAPVANAGTDQNVSTGSTVTLDGSGSSDADTDTLTYSWSFTSLPTGNSAALSDSTALNPTFTVDVDGSYVVSLTVNDGTLDSAADTVTITAATTGGCDSQTEIKVLFIGNSYTSVNDLPNLLKDLACSGGYNLSVTSSTPGGYRFLNHAGDANTLTAIDSQQWDYVILQNQSQVPGWKPAAVTTNSVPHAVTLVNAILANNSETQIIYYVTWGRENGDAQNCGYYSNVCTFTGHTAALLEGYTLYKDATGGTLAKVGTAWEAVVDDGSAPFDSGELWNSDQSHPELLGSYLAAATFYATLFNESPVNLDVPNGISSDNGLYLQQIAQSLM